MNLLGVDIGTTTCKAGLFTLDGTVRRIARRPTPVRRAPQGHTFYDPEELWQTVADAIAAVTTHDPAAARSVRAVGVASMGEAGLLVDARSGAPRTALVPWNDPCATEQGEFLKHAADPLERFLVTGWRAGFKCSLAKILWLRQQDPAVTTGSVWLSVAGYIAHRLTGAMSYSMDYSLASRTFAFDLTRQSWDASWLTSLGLPAGVFPPAVPSGASLGGVHVSGLGLPLGTPVAIAGHDHVCASLAAGVTGPGMVFNSMGTAEAILGVLPGRPLTVADYESGFAFGCHVVPGLLYWIGGISASGGSVEWLRGILAQAPPSYRKLAALLAKVADGPTGILYFPYLSGRGSPHADTDARAAFVGLRASHSRADLAKAVLEGTAYELESILRAAPRATGEPVRRVLTAGGGTRLPLWLQIKADVTGCALEVRDLPEATLLGAALLAGVGAGLYHSVTEAVAALKMPPPHLVEPDAARHAAYRRLYEDGYAPVGQALSSHNLREHP